VRTSSWTRGVKCVLLNAVMTVPKGMSEIMRQDIFDKAYEVYRAEGQVGVFMWVHKSPPELAHTRLYWMHCDPCDCHESPSVNDGESDDILCLVCTAKVGEVLFRDEGEL
jgi:hypothetical protein